MFRAWWVFFLGFGGESRTPELSRVEQEASRGEGWRGGGRLHPPGLPGPCCGGVSMQAASLIAPPKKCRFSFF